MNTVINPHLIIEGPDKVGKDSLIEYLHSLTNYRYCINNRGILSHLVYNDKFNRDKSYTIMYKPLIILLTANEEDQKIRCKITNEGYIDFNKDMDSFLKYSKYLTDNDFAVVWEYNTSNYSLYDLAKLISIRLKSINLDEFIINGSNTIESLNLY